MTSSSGGPAAPLPRSSAGQPRPPVQRWRLYVSIPATPPPAGAPPGGPQAAPTAQAEVPRWPAIVAASAVPLAEGRGRVVVAAPLPARTAGLREVVDVFLAERLTRAAVRAAIGAALPGGWELVDLHDEWTGAASVASLLSAADYRVRVEGAPGEALAAASERLLATATLPRESPRGTGSPPRDLRPLVLDLRVVPGDAPPPGAEPAGTLLAMRLRLGPDAVCRPEQVVAALGEPPLSTPPRPLTVVEIVRERLVLADRPAALPREAGSRAPGTPGSR